MTNRINKVFGRWGFGGRDPFTKRVSSTSASAKACLLITLGILLISLNGCKELRPVDSGFLYHHDVLVREGKTKVFYYDPQGEEKPETHLILLNKIYWRADQKLKPKLEEELKKLARERFKYAILRSVPESILVLEKESEIEDYKHVKNLGVLKVDLAVSSAKKGIGIIRYLIGFGIGKPEVWIDVRATQDSKEGLIEMEISSRGANVGKAFSGMNPRVMFTRYVMRYSFDDAARAAAEILTNKITAPEPDWWSAK